MTINKLQLYSILNFLDYFNDTINWKCHIEHINSKLSAVCYIMRSIKQFFLYGSTALYGPGPPRFVEVSWSHTFETHHSR
jgi:hypothetical protein